MATAPDPSQVAAALRVSIGLLRQRLRLAQVEGELTLPEISALARLDHIGPTSASVLAKVEQISPQSVGVTVAGLKQRGLIAAQIDPDDGRRSVLSLTAAGREAMDNRRTARVEQLARVLATEFTAAELQRLADTAPLIERLAQRL